MSSSVSWKLKRYGRFVPNKDNGGNWKIFEAKSGSPGITLTIVELGYLLVAQGEESLDTVPFPCGLHSLSVHQKSDHLFFRVTVGGESRMMRMQFDGRSRAEAISECSKAAAKLKEHAPPVISQDDAPPHPNQPPAEAPAPARQEGAGGVEPEVVRGSLSIKRLAQHYLGEAAVALPQEYHLAPLPQGGLEAVLRVCLLDPSFNAFVEKVEGELRKLLEE